VHGGRNLDRLDRLNKPIASPFSQQRLRLHEGPDALLQEERVAALAKELLEWSETGIVAEQRVQELPGALHGERVQSHLAVVRLSGPGVLILGPVVHQQQETGSRQALDQVIEQSLGL